MGDLPDVLADDARNPSGSSLSRVGGGQGGGVHVHPEQCEIIGLNT